MFLVAYYFTKPSNTRVRTARAGWMNQPGAVSYDEQVALTTRIKPRDLSMAKIILDLRRRQVVRNSFNDNRNYNEMFEYFAKNYPKYAELMQSVDHATRVKQAPPVEFVPTVSSEVRVVETPTT